MLLADVLSVGNVFKLVLTVMVAEASASTQQRIMNTILNNYIERYVLLNDW